MNRRQVPAAVTAILLAAAIAFCAFGAVRGEPDHVHILLSAPPQASLAKLINSIKTTTSRRIRKEMPDYISEYYEKPLFWSRSYMILSSGGAPIEVIRQYIQEQGTEEHLARKKRKAA
jgi:putative transposase